MTDNINIQLASADQCTGCSVCASVCPTGSISMKEDREGFLQPLIDTKTCIGCHKCEKTCPIITPIKIPTDFETEAYAAINKDEEVRMKSSSGGMFHALAKWTIEQGGVVFGARFNDQWEVVHDYTETIEGIEPFMRSKYVQSRIGDTFKQARQFLDAGRQVLFVGTPCQIGGLKAYLKKGYDNLIAVDFICHGVPSPKVWRQYLKWMRKDDQILDVNFRDKTKGWLGFQQVIITTTTTTTRENQMENVYFRGFLRDVYLRKSCYGCPFKTIHRISDITLADAWGIQHCCPELHDDKGTSYILIHTERGEMVSQAISDGILRKKLQINELIIHNPSIVKSVARPQRRTTYLSAFNFGGFNFAKNYIDKDAIIVRAVRKIRKIFGIKA